ncbi:class I SAM-dependent methyltransferase [filamentous cyanobacterium LEGE 11480]|uniref:Class I SAM-dependent methyltransferase n=1 Tax=Romeriopsis navalis LEGE 11480 TaxID=2777977 RepID=A0A928VUK9_9CYAN|nr:class I SAM-dependent methyltransferase [Romeriopsis navalis]MBE9032860.1 class I SAM-dependent methyltransferase [Romeriopsis navalis LEGE 11480]
MAQSAKFWDIIAKFYAKQPVADEASYQKKLAVTREYLRPDMEVLEFGCGTGSTAIVHAPYVKHIQAVDISAKMLKIAQGKATASNITNITFTQSTLDQLDIPDQSLDVVLGLSILHLLEDKAATIAQVHKILKPGGIFVTSTTCLDGSNQLFQRIMSIGTALGILPLIKFFTVQELVDSFTQSGFEIDHQWQPSPDKAVFIIAKKPM